MTRIFHWFFMWKMDPMLGCDIRLVFHYRPETVHLQYKRCVQLWNNFLYITPLPWLIGHCLVWNYAYACSSFKLIFNTIVYVNTTESLFYTFLFFFMILAYLSSIYNSKWRIVYKMMRLFYLPNFWVGY